MEIQKKILILISQGAARDRLVQLQQTKDITTREVISIQISNKKCTLL